MLLGRVPLQISFTDSNLDVFKGNSVVSHYHFTLFSRNSLSSLNVLIPCTDIRKVDKISESLISVNIGRSGWYNINEVT